MTTQGLLGSQAKCPVSRDLGVAGVLLVIATLLATQVPLLAD